MATELNPTEARQATKRPRAMIWVLTVSLLLALIAGLALRSAGSAFRANLHEVEVSGTSSRAGMDSCAERTGSARISPRTELPR